VQVVLAPQCERGGQEQPCSAAARHRVCSAEHAYRCSQVLV
jgi:hypothetical protein